MNKNQIKIAIVTDDGHIHAGHIISRHFGRAKHYIVYTVDDKEIIEHELRDKSHHGKHAPDNTVHLHETEPHNHGDHPGDHHHDHKDMLSNISDCAVVITRGMGQGAYNALQQAGKEVIITDIADAEASVLAYVHGEISNHLEKLH